MSNLHAPAMAGSTARAFNLGALLVLALAVACTPLPAPQRADPNDDDDPPVDAGPEDEPVVVDPACAENGCLQAVARVGDFSKQQVEQYLMPGVSIDNGYSVFTIQYATDSRSSTATATVPYDVEPPAEGFAVVVNAHGTIGVDDPCRVSNTVSGAGLAGLFGARGAIGVAPDYPGLGTDGIHAYLSTREEGTSVLDAIRAARDLARTLELATSGRAAVVGLSQGGHAVLAAAALHESYAPELDIRAFGAAAPASVYEEHWRAGLSFSGPHVPMYALLVWDWATLADAAQDQMWAREVHDEIGDLMKSRCMWSASFTSEPTLPDAIAEDPALVFAPAFIEAFTTGSWGQWVFMQEAFARNRVVPFSQSAPIRIWQGTDDTVVLPSMTHELVDDLNAAGMQVEIVDVDRGTHIDTAFGFVASSEQATDDSIQWIQRQLR